jgi:transcriptional regulator with XRE-family HTH domain
MSPRQLASRIGVTSKTVERWLADGERVPHARNREDACAALGVDDEVIWPQVVRDKLKTGHDRELVQAYPYRSACPSTVWGKLVADATEDIYFAGYTNYFLWLEQPNFAATLRGKLASGCKVRFLLGDPDGDVTRQRETIEDTALSVSTRIRITLESLRSIGPLEGLETRYSAPLDAINHVSLSVFRFDADVLVTPHLARLVGHDSPLMHLRRQGDGGMFDRFAEHAEELWTGGKPVHL